MIKRFNQKESEFNSFKVRVNDLRGSYDYDAVTINGQYELNNIYFHMKKSIRHGKKVLVNVMTEGL